MCVCVQVVAVEIDTPAAAAASADLKPVPFGLYRSPLLFFKSYRLIHHINVPHSRLAS